MEAAGITLALALSCAPMVAPDTLARVVQVESGGNVFAINVNKLRDAQPQARSTEEATRIAKAYIARGYSVDMGLMQVNSGNLRRLGHSVADMFDPCTNLAAGASILTENYKSAKNRRDDPQEALQAALSAYNTGHFQRGFQNGYVQKYLRGPTHVTLVPGVSGNENDIAAAEARPTIRPGEETGGAAVVLERMPPGADPLREFQEIGQPDPYRSSTTVIAPWRNTK